MGKYILFLTVLVVLAVGAGLIVIYSGRYDVAATDQGLVITDWILGTTMEHSVARHAQSIVPPSDLSDPTRVRRGAELYGALCATCHGAPGVDPSEIGRGLQPAPPSLQEAAPDWSANELYWIVDHGVKFTGMPAFEPTEDESKLWDIVAFVRKMPNMSEDDYRRLGLP